jgi:hypothetical protein
MTGRGHPKIPRTAHQDIIARVRAGEVLRVVGADYGVTRQAIQQVLAKIDPAAVTAGQHARVAARMRRKATERAERARAKLDGKACVVCWQPITNPHSMGVTCGGRCLQLWVLVRYHLDPDHHQRHRIAGARIVLRDPGRYPQHQDLARRVLAGEPPNRRYSWSPQVQAALAEVARLRAATTSNTPG